MACRDLKGWRIAIGSAPVRVRYHVTHAPGRCSRRGGFLLPRPVARGNREGNHFGQTARIGRDRGDNGRRRQAVILDAEQVEPEPAHAHGARSAKLGGVQGARRGHAPTCAPALSIAFRQRVEGSRAPIAILNR